MSRQAAAPVAVAVTGGVASGKSTVTAMFEALGVPVVDADVAARELVAPGSEGLEAVVSTFGDEVLRADGSLDRGAMRARVFGNPDERRRLEAILHPRIEARLREQTARIAAGSEPPPYIVVAIPLLTEVGRYSWLDRVLVVDVPEAVQMRRVMTRDGIDAQAARRMLAAQAGRDQRLAIADDVIVNDADLDTLRQRVDALDARYRHMSQVGTTVPTSRRWQGT